MKASVIKAFGGTDRFELAELPKPEVRAGQVLVRIAATSVNTVDMMIRDMGTDLAFAPPLPAVLGMDFAGTVEAVGEGVSDYQVGDEVYGCAGGLGDLPGTLAEYIAADARLIAPKPKNLTMRQAAAIPLVGITAYEGLSRAGLSHGQSVLIHGGAGGVGNIAIQLAKHYGGQVFATGLAGAQQTLMTELGATAIDFTSETVDDYVARYTGNVGFDVIMDTVGGANLSNSFAAARLNGQVATTLALHTQDLSMAHIKGLSLHVVFMLIPMIHNQGRDVHGRILKELCRIAEAGDLIPVLDEHRFGLADVGKAHDYLASGQALGKVVIDID